MLKSQGWVSVFTINHLFNKERFYVCHVSMLPWTNLYRHTFVDTRVHIISQKVSHCFLLTDFFSVIKECLSTVPKFFVQCYKRAATGDYAWLTGPAFTSTWCTKIKLVSKETSSSCEVHCFYTARSRIQVFSNIEGSVWDFKYPYNCELLGRGVAAKWLVDWILDWGVWVLAMARVCLHMSLHNASLYIHV